MLTKIVALFIHEVRKELDNLQLAEDLVPAAKKVLLEDDNHGGIIAQDKSDISEPAEPQLFGFNGTRV